MASSRHTDRRRLGAWLWHGGRLLASGGALGVLAGSIAPWVQLSLFGVPLAAPGLLFAGAWSAAAGLVGLSILRRAPFIAAIAGVIALGVGMSQGKPAVQSVSRQILSVRMRLMSVNRRLEQVRLSPIEPFGEVSRAEPGPGPTGVVFGSVVLVLGGISAGLGERWRRCCPQCRTLWPESRLPTLLHCPGCGLRRTSARQCQSCWHVAEKSDKHCAHCGEALKIT
jgi:hypothetical protein